MGYIVHLCHAYMESTKSERKDRSRDAATSMGVSVVSGAITTFSAAVFLLLTKMTFFFEFGVFMAMTVCFSIFFALTLFIALVTELGPVRDESGNSTGDVKPMLVKMGVLKEAEAKIQPLPEATAVVTAPATEESKASDLAPAV